VPQRGRAGHARQASHEHELARPALGRERGERPELLGLSVEEKPDAAIGHLLLFDIGSPMTRTDWLRPFKSAVQ
jgi:hypothetical protein